MPSPGSRLAAFCRPRRSTLAVVAAFGCGGFLGLFVHGGESPAAASPANIEQHGSASLAPVSPGAPPALAAVPAAQVPDLESAVPAPIPAPLPQATLERTPLGEDEAAVHLARAWVSVAGVTPSAETLSVLWAQWAHETGRGRRMRGYNFAGIKGNGPDGDSFVAWTREVTPSPERRMRDTFRAYSTPEGGAHDYVRLISSRYPAAWRAAVRGDVTRFVRALDLGGYFTDSDRAYSRALSSLARECLERAVPRRALEVVARGALVPGAEPTAL